MMRAVFRYAVRNLSRRKSRSAFAIAGIAIGISAVISLVAISSGLLAAIEAVLAEFPGELMVTMRGAGGLEHSIIDEVLVPEIENLDEVTWAEPFIFRFHNFELPKIPGIALSGGHAIIPFYGIKPGGKMHEMFQVVDGTGFTGKSLDEVMIGAEFAKQWRATTGLKNLPSVIPVNENTTWRVVGEFKTGSIQDIALVVPYDGAQNVVQMHEKASAILIGVNSGANLAALTGDPFARIKTRIDKLLPTNAQVARPQEFLAQFQGDLARLQSLVFSIGLIAAIAGAFGVLNTMMSNVHERTRELGLLLAVGWRPREVMAAVLTEGFSLSLIGGLLAIPIALVWIEIAQMLIRFNPIPGGIDPFIYIVGILLSVTLGVFGSLLPSYRASRLSPVEALREL